MSKSGRQWHAGDAGPGHSTAQHKEGGGKEVEQSRREAEPEQRGPGRPLQRRPAPYLRQWMRQHGQRGDRVAEAIGLNPQQMYRKLNGAQPFSLTQARAIARFLRVDYAEVFPGDDGVDPRELIAQRVAEAGPERRHAS